jgi:hypothetical protein
MYKPDPSHQRKPSAMPSHNLEDKCARMRDGSRVDVVDSFADPMQRRWRPDCEIGQGHIIVYGSNEAHDPEVPMAQDLIIRDAIWPESTEITAIPGGRCE